MKISALIIIFIVTAIQSMIRLLCFSVWVQFSFSLADAQVKPEFIVPARSESSERAAETTSPTITPTWYHATGDYIAMRGDVANILEMKRDLRALDGYPQQLPLNQSNNVTPVIALASQLRKFQLCSSQNEVCSEQLEMEDFGFDSETQVFPAINLHDRDYDTICSISGSDEAPAWVLLILPGNVFVGQVILYVSQLLEQVDSTRLSEELRVNLEWFDMRITCDDLEPFSTDSSLPGTEEDYQLMSSCGGHIARRIFLQMDRHTGKSIAINLTLSEMEIVGNPSSYPRVSLRSPRMEFVNSVVNIYFKGSSEAHRGRLHSNVEVLHVLAIAIGHVTLIPVSRMLTLQYNNGLVNVSLEKCGYLSRSQTVNLVPPPCVHDQTLPPCSWTLVFLYDSLEVYIDKSLAGIFRKDTGNCSGSQSSCTECQKIFSKGLGLSYYGNDFALDVVEIGDSLIEPKVITRKSERHNFCYNEEIILVMMCDYLITQNTALMNKTSQALVYGFEALGVSDLLEEEFMENYSDVLAQLVIDSIGLDRLQYFESPEYLLEVENTYVDELLNDNPDMLTEAELLKTIQIERHGRIFRQLMLSDVDDRIFEIEVYLRDIEFTITSIMDLPWPSTFHVYEEWQETLEYMLDLKEKLNNRRPADVEVNPDQMDERSHSQGESPDHVSTVTTYENDLTVFVENVGPGFILNPPIGANPIIYADFKYTKQYW